MSTLVRRALRGYLRTPWLHVVAGVAALAGAWCVIFGVPGIDEFNAYRIDVDVYRIGGRMILDGQPLYGPVPLTEIGVELPFTYPPVAAVLFTVLALVPLPAAGTGLAIASVAGFVAVLRLVVRDCFALRGRELWAATALATAVLVWIDPLRQTLDFGQINALLMLCIVVDVCAGRGRWWRGTWTGLAIAVKLTPAVFLAFFLLRRDWRAMAVTVGSTLAWTALGFLVRPADSWQYWTEVLVDTDRIGHKGYTSNQAFSGLLHRLVGPDVSTLWWFLGCVVVGLFVLALVHRLGDDEAAAMVVLGLYALFASPISWSHHWVWMGPAVVVVLAVALRGRSWAAWPWLVVALVTLWSAPQWWWPYEGDAGYHWVWYQDILGHTWMWLLLTSYAILWIEAGRRRAPAH